MILGRSRASSPVRCSESCWYLYVIRWSLGSINESDSDSMIDSESSQIHRFHSGIFHFLGSCCVTLMPRCDMVHSYMEIRWRYFLEAAAVSRSRARVAWTIRRLAFMRSLLQPKNVGTRIRIHVYREILYVCCMHTVVLVFKHTHMYTFTHICIYIHIHIHFGTWMYEYVHIWIYICMHTYVRVHVCIHIYEYTYIHTCI